MLNSLQQSNNIFPNNNGIGRASMQKPDLGFANNSNQNRMNPSGYPNNSNGGMNGFMGNRPLGHTSSGFIQPNVFGNNGGSIIQPQHLMSSQMRPGHGQLQGHPDKLMSQPYPNATNGYPPQQLQSGVSRPMAAPNNGFNPMNNEWNPYHESIQFPPPSV
jgi:hypothetical protein